LPFLTVFEAFSGKDSLKLKNAFIQPHFTKKGYNGLSSIFFKATDAFFFKKKVNESDSTHELLAIVTKFGGSLS